MPAVEFLHVPSFCPHCGAKRPDDAPRWRSRDGQWDCSVCPDCGCHYGVQGARGDSEDADKKGE